MWPQGGSQGGDFWKLTVPLSPQEEMTSALATMRVDYDQVKIKDLDMSNNPLLNKRRQRPGAGGADSGGDGDGAEGEVKHREVTFAAE